MSEDIKPEWIEKAAEEINAEKHRYRVDHSTWVPYCTCGWSGESAHDVGDYTRHLAALALEAVADDLRAEAWDEGHRTPQQREMDDCHCYASSAGECSCGRFGTGRIITPNPYRKNNLT